METESNRQEAFATAHSLLKDWFGQAAADKMGEYICWSVLVACVLPNLGGIFGSFFLKNSLNTWYKELKKAPWNPPDWAFGPMWTMLYTAMGFASYLVWRDGGGFTDKTLIPLGLYGAQLVLNWAWVPIFFGYRSIKWSLVDIIILDVLVAVCAVSFSHVNLTAAAIFIPYMGWLCMATTLSIYAYTHNQERHHHHKKPHKKDN